MLADEIVIFVLMLLISSDGRTNVNGLPFILNITENAITCSNLIVVWMFSLLFYFEYNVVNLTIPSFGLDSLILAINIF